MLSRPQKSPPDDPKRPAIWAQGAQFDPFDRRSWASSSMVLARRAAAGALRGTAARIEEAGLWLDSHPAPRQGWTRNLGAMRALIPSRQDLGDLLWGLAAWPRAAAKEIDSPPEKVAPLEILDFGAHAARLRRRGRRRPDPEARQRIRRLGNRRAEAETAAASQRLRVVEDAEASRQDLPEAELEAIRAALEAGRAHVQPQTRRVTLPDPAAPQTRGPAPRLFEHAGHQNGSAATEPAALHLRPGPFGALLAWIPLWLRRSLAWAGRRLGGLLARGLAAAWARLRSPLGLLAARTLGWTSVAIALPWSMVRALILHLDHVPAEDI